MTTKKALCVGINNYPGLNNDLRGCVNDANAWASLLRNHFGFTDVQMLLDSQATKQNILDGLADLISGAEPGDVLVFTNSSHGTYVADSSEDEEYDEAMCAVDINILDDELRSVFDTIPEGVNLTAILDNCHSGTGSRLIIDLEDVEEIERFLPPSARGLPEIEDFENATPKSSGITEEQMTEILLSGCLAEEVSWDVKIGSTFHGAMTYCAIKAIEEANYQITYSQLQQNLQAKLDQKGYTQHPQLEGKAANKEKLIFS